MLESRVQVSTFCRINGFFLSLAVCGSLANIAIEVFDRIQPVLVQAHMG